MKDWIPFFQSLVWPVFILALIYHFRGHFVSIVAAIRARIEKGDPFEAGTGGIKLGPGPLNAALGREPTPGSQPLLKDFEAPMAAITVEQDKEARAPAKSAMPEGPRIYLVHTARRDRTLDYGDYSYYRLRIFLESEEENDLDQVLKVIYHLHPTFRNPDRTVTDRRTNFELRTSAWGTFNLTAEVFLKDEPIPLRLERYLNF